MIAAGRSYCRGDGIELCVGDGENLSSVVEASRFDYALYNASIFIFPDVSKTIAEAHRCLRDGGKIAFSFYPQLLGEDDADLFALAFERLGEPLPRFRVITGYTKACEALETRCVDIRHHRWVRPLDIEFLQDFFSIPAQSASLFPGQDYEVRRELAMRLFGTLDDQTDTGRIVWRMAEGTKSAAV
jgi:SAM-dependent methyltransferase